jgi:hypothetical protein
VDNNVDVKKIHVYPLKMTQVLKRIQHVVFCDFFVLCCLCMEVVGGGGGELDKRNAIKTHKIKGGNLNLTPCTIACPPLFYIAR